MNNFCLIYKITNIANGKVYIGQTWKILKERHDSGHGYKGCIHLERAIKKYQWKNFKSELLTITHTQECADYWEIYFIKQYKSTDREFGYNIRLGGSRGLFSEETRKKMSESGKLKIFTEQHKLNMSKSGKGRVSNRKGIIMTEEQKTKISDTMKEKVKLRTRDENGLFIKNK